MPSRYRHVARAGVLLFATVGMTPQMLRAQTPSTSSSGNLLGLSPLVAVSSAPFADYTRPTMCVAAAEREEAQARRTVAAQLPFLEFRADTLPLAATAVDFANSCGARFWTRTGDLVPADSVELPGLVRLALWANQDQLAQTAGDRWRTLAHDTMGQAEVVLQQMRLVVETRPLTARRVQAVHTALATLHHFGPAAIEEDVVGRLYNEGLVGSRLGTPLQAAFGADSLASFWRQLPTRAERLRFEYMLWWANGFKITNLLALPVGKLNTTVASQVYTQGYDQFIRDINLVRPVQPDSLRDFATYLQVNGVLPKAPPLQAQRWFNRSDPTTPLPRPGVPTVIVWMNQNCGEGCYQEYAHYRRLYDELTPKGVQFILMTRTQGWRPGSAMLTSDQEVDSIRAYVMDHLKLRGILGVQVTQFQTLADGRRAPIASTVEDAYQPGQGTVSVSTASGLWFRTASLNCGDLNDFWNAEVRLGACIANQVYLNKGQ